MAKSNFEKVESVVGWVRDKKITGYRISKETNAREMSIIALAQGRAKVKTFRLKLRLAWSIFMIRIIKNSKIKLRYKKEGKKLPFFLYSNKSGYRRKVSLAFFISIKGF